MAFEKFLKNQKLRAAFAKAAGSSQESYGPDLELLLSSTHLPPAETKSQRSPAFFRYGLSVLEGRLQEAPSPGRLQEAPF